MIPEGALPYPGLRAFERDESHLFFGRERDVDALIDRLATTRFLAVIGTSGSGKSSLVRTGLLSALDLGYFARAGAHWTVAEMTPGGQPLENLAAALDSVRSADSGAIPVGLLRRLLGEGPRSIVQWREAGNLAPDQNLLILVDQFEELFRYSDYAAREEAEAFVALLLESAREADSRIHIVLTMRSEYLGACALLPGLAEEINSGLYLTPRMSRDACRSAIEGPARLVGLTLEPALVNQILNELAAFAPWEQDAVGAQGQLLSRRADQLPLMQHLLNRLWVTAEPGADGKWRLTLADYERLGGLSGALDAHGAEMLASLEEDDRAGAEHVFRALVSGADPTSAVRRPSRFDDLVANLGGDSARARRIVDAFRASGCNFLRPPTPQPLGDSTIVDISHESLIRQWSVLAGWMRAEARATANWHRLVRAQERHAHREGDLLSGLELDGLAAWWDGERPNAAWAGRHGGDFAAVADFLAASRAAKAEAERSRLDRAKREKARLVGTLAVVSLLLILSVVTMLYAYVQNGRLAATIAETTKARSDQRKAVAAMKAANSSLARAARERAAAIEETRQQQEASQVLERRNEEMAGAQARIEAEQRARLQEADGRLAMVLSVAGHPENVRDTIDYCRSTPNEAACRILVSGGADRSDRSRN